VHSSPARARGGRRRPERPAPSCPPNRVPGSVSWVAA
jgi:hypothetical protein